MPFNNIFTTITTGVMVFTGNTLGLSKSSGSNNAGTNGSIGAFSSITEPQYDAYPSPPGTTLDYTKNESEAVLEILAGSTVLHAELVWGGGYISPGGTQDYTNEIDDDVFFTTPDNITHTISPRGDTAMEFAAGSSDWYVRSADVTDEVQAAGAGIYSAGGIVGTNDPNDNNGNNAGWTLQVVYQNSTLPTRLMSLYVGGVYISGDTDETISGFKTPSSGTITGRVFISAQEGDANITGDQLLFGPTAASVSNLSGLNNPEMNFFSSQVNIADPLDPNVEQVDTRGSFGNDNHNAFAGTNITGGRQGWDITSVDASSQLVPNQTSAVLRFTTVGDRYLPNSFGVQILAQAANLQLEKSAAPLIAEVGDTLTYTIVITNTGEIDAFDINFLDIIPVGTTYVAESFAIDGIVIPGADPNVGVAIDPIMSLDSITVTFDVTVDSQPVPTFLSNEASTTFEFTPIPGEPPIEGSSTSNSVITSVESIELTLIKSVDKSTAKVGDTLVYTISITNTGSTNVSDVVFVDFPPEGTSFVADSVFVDTVSTSESPISGVTIGPMTIGQSVTVEFSVIVTNEPTSNPILNMGRVDFNVGDKSKMEYSNNAATTIQSIEDDDCLAILKNMCGSKTSVLDLCFKFLCDDEPSPEAPCTMGYFYTFSSGNVATNTAIDFPQPAITRGAISQVINPSEIMISSTGLYEVTYSITEKNSNVASFGLELTSNSVTTFLPQTRYSGGNTQYKGGQTFIEVTNVPAVLKLIAKTIISLDSGSGSDISASLIIKKICDE